MHPYAAGFADRCVERGFEPAEMLKAGQHLLPQLEFGAPETYGLTNKDLAPGQRTQYDAGQATKNDWFGAPEMDYSGTGSFRTYPKGPQNQYGGGMLSATAKLNAKMPSRVAANKPAAMPGVQAPGVQTPAAAPAKPAAPATAPVTPSPTKGLGVGGSQYLKGVGMGSVTTPPPTSPSIAANPAGATTPAPKPVAAPVKPKNLINGMQVNTAMNQTAGQASASAAAQAAKPVNPNMPFNAPAKPIKLAGFMDRCAARGLDRETSIKLAKLSAPRFATSDSPNYFGGAQTGSEQLGAHLDQRMRQDYVAPDQSAKSKAMDQYESASRDRAANPNSPGAQGVYQSALNNAAGAIQQNPTQPGRMYHVGEEQMKHQQIQQGALGRDQSNQAFNAELEHRRGLVSGYRPQQQQSAAPKPTPEANAGAKVAPSPAKNTTTAKPAIPPPSTPQTPSAASTAPTVPTTTSNNPMMPPKPAPPKATRPEGKINGMAPDAAIAAIDVNNKPKPAASAPAVAKTPAPAATPGAYNISLPPGQKQQFASAAPVGRGAPVTGRTM